MHSEALRTAEGLATVFIALYVAAVGTLQWLIAREKLRRDLYDRRFDVYVRTLEFLQALVRWQEISGEIRLATRIGFIRAVRESRFLFSSDPRILQLLEKVNERSFKVTGFIEELSKWSETMPEMYVQAYEEKQTALDWIVGTTADLEKMLDPYLAFGHSSLRRPRSFR